MKSRKAVAVLTVIALLCVGCVGCGGGEGSASVMRLMKTEGTVGVSDEKGENVSLAENMNLYGGYQMGTEEKSHAWIALDDVKLAKMDEESEIEIQKDGKKLEVVVNSGGVFFNVTEPLKADETFEIRTSTMTVGIRGTCGWVKVFDENHMNVYILEGTVECTVTDSKSGESRTEQVSGGEKAELHLYSAGESSEGEKCDIIKDELELNEIPFYILEELLADEDLGKKTNEASDLQIPKDGTAQAHVLRGNAHIIDGETEENFALSQADYEKAMELDDTEAGVYLGLADLEIRRGEYDAAMDILEDGLEKASDNAEIKDKIAEMESGEITDSQHRTRRYSFLEEDGSLRWYHEYFYDAQGRKTRAVSYDAAGTQTSAGEELYDEAGRQLQTWSWYDEDGRLSKNIHEYDENGNQIRTDSYGKDGELRSYTIREYDGEGHRIKLSRYSPEGSLQNYDSFEYDENGKQTKQSRYTADGKLDSYRLYEYDENGKNVKSSQYGEDGELKWYTLYEYDEDGNRISEQRITVGE